METKDKIIKVENIEQLQTELIKMTYDFVGFDKIKMNKYEELLNAARTNYGTHSKYYKTVKELVDKAYSNCFPVYADGTCPYHNQNIPTEEEIIKEWEKLGYKWVENEIYIHITKKDKLLCVVKDICITKQDKEYCCYDEDEDYSCLFITSKEHQLLTKTFKMLGWK